MADNMKCDTPNDMAFTQFSANLGHVFQNTSNIQTWQIT